MAYSNFPGPDGRGLSRACAERGEAAQRAGKPGRAGRAIACAERGEAAPRAGGQGRDGRARARAVREELAPRAGGSDRAGQARVRTCGRALPGGSADWWGGRAFTTTKGKLCTFR
jgi:hypothetical protein